MQPPLCECYFSSSPRFSSGFMHISRHFAGPQGIFAGISGFLSASFSFHFLRYHFAYDDAADDGFPTGIEAAYDFAKNSAFEACSTKNGISALLTMQLHTVALATHSRSFISPRTASSLLLHTPPRLAFLSRNFYLPAMAVPAAPPLARYLFIGVDISR